VFDNLSRGSFCNLKGSGLECLKGDIRDVGHLQRAMQGCDVAFHLAAEATVMGCERRSIDAHETNVTGTFNVLRTAQKVGVRRVIFASSREVYGEVADLPVSENAPIMPKNVYGATKAAGEMYCSWASSALEVTVLRLTNVFGPGDTDRVLPRFMADANAGRPLTVYGGAQIVDFVWVHNVIDAFIRAGLGPYVPGSVNVGSGAGVTIMEAAKRVIQLSGSDSELDILPTREAEVIRFIANVSRARHELGLACPSHPLNELATMCVCEPLRTGPSEATVNGEFTC